MLTYSALTAPFTMRCSGRNPESMAKPIAIGTGTIAAINPAVKSRKMFSLSEPLARSS